LFFFVFLLRCLSLRFDLWFSEELLSLSSPDPEACEGDSSGLPLAESESCLARRRKLCLRELLRFPSFPTRAFSSAVEPFVAGASTCRGGAEGCGGGCGDAIDEDCDSNALLHVARTCFSISVSSLLSATAQNTSLVGNINQEAGLNEKVNLLSENIWRWQFSATCRTRRIKLSAAN
jgi:hypothetical protein